MTVRPPSTCWLPYGYAVVGCVALLVVIGMIVRRSPAEDLPSREAYLAEWARIHGVAEPSGLVRWWLSGAYSLARPLAGLGVSPDLLTLAGLVTAGLVPCLAASGARWPIVAGLVVAVSAGLDNLDGAVAVLARRTTAWGYLVDSLVDRVSDGAYLVAFWVLGAAAWLCVLAGGLLFLLEYARARAGNAGRGELTVITVGERPTRVIIASAFLISAGIFPGSADVAAAIGAAATASVCVIGLGQLLAAGSALLKQP